METTFERLDKFFTVVASGEENWRHSAQFSSFFFFNYRHLSQMK